MDNLERSSAAARWRRRLRRCSSAHKRSCARPPRQQSRPEARGRPQRAARVFVVHSCCGPPRLVAATLATLTTLQGGTKSAVAATLGRLAAVPADQPAVTPPPAGEYRDSASDNEELATDASDSDLQPDHRQIWLAPDASGRLVETRGAPAFLTPSDRAAWVAAGSPPIDTGTTDTALGPGGLDDGPRTLSSLPTDPYALAAASSSRAVEGGPPGAGEDVIQIGDLLRETDAPPRLRAAALHVTAGLAGVSLLGTVTDHSGRAG